MYFNLRGRRDIAIAYACTGVPAYQRRSFPLGHPLVVRIIDRYLGSTGSDLEAARRRSAQLTLSRCARAYRE